MIILNGSDQWSREYIAMLDNYKGIQVFIQKRWKIINMGKIVEFLPDSRNYFGKLFYSAHAPQDKYMIEMALLSRGAVMLCEEKPTFNTLLPYIIDDPSFYSKEQVLASALQKLGTQKSFIACFNQEYMYSTGGILKNQIMIVGEQVKPDRSLAFISERGCSRFLHGCLMSNVHDRYYLSNAIKTEDFSTDVSYLLHEMKLVNPIKIIGMGKVAAKYLSEAGMIPFTETYHPQYWKRFRFSDKKSLIKILKHDQIKDRTGTAI